ncbi:hypothetical protein C2845_PM15G04720 [Panicum miliaceum]|uniref:SANTA domain-containing protein n=1 Tax=Panicum miliaceum TaxID=4540 RepID=A0A3L6Q9P6_PANMI|nr:hypothetical protein C2845_PM15G04720 [Panicum miliaceum]
MQPPQTPIPPWGSKPRRDMQPSLLSPSFSRKPFQAAAAAAAGDEDADSSEHPCVTLFEWWLERVEGDDQKVAVAGIFERNQTVQEFAPATIAKRHEPCVLETEDGIILLIYGSLSLSRMRANGYSSEVCEKFMIGFPYRWQNCNQLYPKAAQTGSDAKQFYLEKFQLGQQFHSYGSSLLSELRNSVENSSHNDAAFQKSSHLPNGAPRFEEYNSDGDIAINENAAASNDGGERHEAARNEAYNVETDLIACRALRERDDGDIDTNASLVLIVDCANDASNEEADNATPTSTCKKRDPVVPLKTQGCCEKTRHIALSKKAAVDEEMLTSVCLDAQNSSDLSNGTPRFEKNTCIGDIPTNEDAAASNGNSERCTAVSEEVNSVETGLTVGSTIRERGHDDIATNVSSAPTVECTNDAVNEGIDNTSLLGMYNYLTAGCKETPVASLKSQGCQEKHQHISSNDKHSYPPKKQRSALEKLQGATRSPFTSPVPYAHESPLTRGRATSLSMSTPEALKLRKTRSGRVVVPTLDAGCQRIVYDMDGRITGVIGLDSPSPKGSKQKTYARRKREAEPPEPPSKLKTYARKKRRARGPNDFSTPGSFKKFLLGNLTKLFRSAFMGNVINTVKRFSSNDATAIPVQRCSDLSIGTSELDKCTCIGNGISVTRETASASKEGSINGCKDFCEVANEEMRMTPGSTSTKGCLGDIDLLTPPMVHTRSSRSDDGNNERETPNGTVHTDARELGCVDHSEKSGLIYSQTAGHMFHNLEDENTETPRNLMLDISKDSLCKVSPEGNSFRNPKLADAVESSPAADAHKGKELILHRVSPADGLFDRNVCEELADGAPDSCYKSNAEVSLDGQRHEQSTQHKSLNYDVVPIEVIAACANLDVSSSKSSLKGRAKRKRITKASSQMLVSKENTGTLIPSDLICVETDGCISGITNLEAPFPQEASSLEVNRKVAGRVFRSAAIAMRHNDTAIETEDGCFIQIGRVLNIPRTRDNGFPQKVCECFEFGFPLLWRKLLNPNMEQQNEQSQSESSANAPRHSVEYYMEKLLSDTPIDPMRYVFTENDFYSSIGYSSNTDGPAIQSLSNLTDGNAGNMAASWGLYGGTRNMPEKPLTPPPGETCNSGQESDRHESTQIDASEQGIVNRSVSSVSVNLSTGSICPNSKVDDSILVPSKIMPVEKEGYRSRVYCCQAEEAADIPENRNTQSCSRVQEMVTLPIDSAIVNENLNSTSSDLGEPGTPKCGKASVNLGTTDALELTTEGMTPQFGAARGSEDSTVKRLRSGKVFGTPSGGPVKRYYKKKNIQHEASSKMMAPNERGTSTTDLTSHENDSSATEIVAEDKEESHDSHRKVDGNEATQGLLARWISAVDTELAVLAFAVADSRSRLAHPLLGMGALRQPIADVASQLTGEVMLDKEAKAH